MKKEQKIIKNKVLINTSKKIKNRNYLNKTIFKKSKFFFLKYKNKKINFLKNNKKQIAFYKNIFLFNNNYNFITINTCNYIKIILLHI